MDPVPTALPFGVFVSVYFFINFIFTSGSMDRTDAVRATERPSDGP